MQRGASACKTYQEQIGECKSLFFVVEVNYKSGMKLKLKSITTWGEFLSQWHSTSSKEGLLLLPVAVRLHPFFTWFHRGTILLLTCTWEKTQSQTKSCGSSLDCGLYWFNPKRRASMALKVEKSTQSVLIWCFLNSKLYFEFFVW